MKKIILITLIIINFILYIPTIAKNRKMILDGKNIVIDPGHGGKDVGASYKDIYEKDINLNISLYLKKELERFGANVILTREGDYDLSYPNASFRKKSDFNNRIRIINENNTDIFLSIHQNYYRDSKYSGTQIFYKGNKELADYIQEKINPKRKTKKISNELYMYSKIKTEGLLIECGFLSNYQDRKKLTSTEYQKLFAKEIVYAIVEYLTKN